MQVITEEQFTAADFNIFDNAKEWPTDSYLDVEVGKLVLNENPSNHFSQIEQMAFSPNNMVPGIRPSQDKILQARLLAYGPAQRYRLGTNYQQLPSNCPISTVRNYQRDGFMRFNNQGNATNYFPNSYDNLTTSAEASTLNPSYTVSGVVDRYDGSDSDYSQATEFFENTLSEREKTSVATNFAAIVATINPELQTRVLDLVEQVSSDLASRIGAILAAA